MKKCLYFFLMLCPFLLANAFFDIAIDDPQKHIFEHFRDTRIMTTFPDGNFYPEKNLTRAEALAVALRSGGIVIPENFDGKTYFSDVDPNSWYAKIINRAVETEVIYTENNIFSPNIAVTKAGFLAMLFRATQVNFRPYFSKTKNIASDIKEDDWFAPHFAYAKQFQIAHLPPDNMYRPYKTLSRREAAIMTFRQLKLFHGDKITKIFVELQAQIERFMTLLRAGEDDKAALKLQRIIELNDDMTLAQNDENAVAAGAMSKALTHFSDGLRSIKSQQKLNALENLMLAGKQAKRAASKSENIAPFANQLSKLILEILVSFSSPNNILLKD